MGSGTSQGSLGKVVFTEVQSGGGTRLRFLAATWMASRRSSSLAPSAGSVTPPSSITQALECELQLSPPCCFTDSTVTLCWSKGTDKTWKPFVQNCVDEIRKLVPPDSWKHCSGRDNPADIPSRGLAPLELSVSVRWREGPSWLGEGDQGANTELQLPTECLAEMRVTDRQAVHDLLTTGDTTGLGQIMDCKEFSSLDRLLSTTDVVLRFCKFSWTNHAPMGLLATALQT